MVACGNSLEVNISSNVVIFVGQGQINLLASIIKSTIVPTSTSNMSTETAAVVPTRTFIPYQAVLSGNEITVCLFQPASSTQHSPSSSKIQPLIQITIDHPLCTVTSNGNSVQYSVSCYDAHVNMAISGKELSSKYWDVYVCYVLLRFCYFLWYVLCIMFAYNKLSVWRTLLL